MLTCPKCRGQFPLTFERYFKAGQGFYTCPTCAVECQLHLPNRVKTIERAVLIPGAIVCGCVGAFMNIFYGLLATLGWLLLNIPFNMYLDGRAGQLKLVGAKPGQPAKKK